jgi:hypothetical protein
VQQIRRKKAAVKKRNAQYRAIGMIWTAVWEVKEMLLPVVA